MVGPEVLAHTLNHATVNVQLANHFMKLKQWEKAEHYAEAAARSGAEWAMTCAQRCAEGREDWTAAESYARQASERYPEGGWATWFLFCKRTGHGDLQSARELAQQCLQPIDKRPVADKPVGIGYFHLKNHGKVPDARRYLKTAIDLPGVDEWGQALAADALRAVGDDAKVGKAADALPETKN
jgi:RimJ/RimL family protein N-acetyltransferase